MSRLERLRRRRLSTQIVTFPAVGDDEPERIEVRALEPERWDALVLEHPPTPAQAAENKAWNVDTLRPALLAEAVVTPDGEVPLGVQDWAQLFEDSDPAARSELMVLFEAAYFLNDRSPLVSVGKA